MSIFRTWRALICGVLALLGSTTAPLASAAPVAESCARVYVLVIPGTWEGNSRPQVHGILSPAVAGLPGDVDIRQIRYDATAFPWEHGGNGVYGKSKATAVVNANAVALRIVQRCPAAKIALLGYSQGADAAGDVAASIGTGSGVISPDKVASVVLLADPRRSRTDPVVGPALTGEGSGGPRQGGFGWLTNRVHSICAAQDLYCNLPKDYYVSRVAGFLAETSDPNPLRIGEYYAEAQAIFGELLTRGGPGAVVNELSNAKAREQIIAYTRFLQSGAHVDYGRYQVEPGVSALSWIHAHLASL